MGGQGVDGPVGQLNVVYVDDVDAQYERVRAAVGESVELTTPQDQPYGARLFTVQDVGGNSWTFWQHISDVVDLPVGWQEIRAEHGQNAVTRKNIEQSEREHELG